MGILTLALRIDNPSNGFEKESTNRGRAEKSRLKKEDITMLEAKFTDDTLASRIKHWSKQHKGTGIGYGHVLGQLAVHMKEMGWNKSFKEVARIAVELGKKKTVEGFGGELKGKDKQKFEKARKENAEQLGYKLTGITDIKEAEASYDLSVAREIDAKNQSDIIFEKLSLITGHQHNKFSPLSNNMTLSLPEPSDSQAWVDKAIQHNLDLLAQIKKLEIAEDEIEHQRADHYPTVDVVGSTSNTDKGGGVSGATETDNNMISIELNIPLFFQVLYKFYY